MNPRQIAQPYVRVQILTRDKLLEGTQRVVSVETRKSLREAAGTWSVEIKPQTRGELRFWEENISPMDVVAIDMGSAGHQVMLGIVDRPARSIQATGAGATTDSFTLSGRDMGKVFLVDTVQYYPTLADSAWSQQFPLPLMQIDTMEFRGKPIATAVEYICENMPVVDTRLPGGHSIREFFDYTSRIEQYPEDRVWNEGLSCYTGPVWNYLEACYDPHFYLATVQSGWATRKAYLTIRPWPYDEGGPFSWRQAKTFASPGHQYHRLRRDDILSQNTAKSDADVKTVYQVLPDGWSVAVQSFVDVFRPLVADGTAQEGADGSVQTEDLTTRFGWRPMTVTSHLLPQGAFGTKDEAGDVVVGESNVNAITHCQRRRDKAYQWHHENDRLYSGQISVRGRPQIREGDYVFSEWDGRLYMVESVSNSWQAHQAPFRTTLEVSRGKARRVESARGWAA